MNRTKLATLLLTASLLPVSPALAQQAAGQDFGILEDDSVVAPEITFDLDFPGGPIDMFIHHLREISDYFPNIIVPDAASHVHVPGMTLRNITITDLTAVLNEIGRTGSDNEQFGFTRTTDNVWTVVAPKAVSPNRNQHVLFFPISRHLEDHSIDDISTTVATAWEMLKLPGNPTSHIRFHEDTKLLIASGTEQMIVVVQDALDALQADGRSSKERKLLADLERAKDQLNAIETNSKLSAQINQERSMVIQDDLRRNLDELREENAVLRSKLRDLESALAASRSK